MCKYGHTNKGKVINRLINCEVEYLYKELFSKKILKTPT